MTKAEIDAVLERVRTWPHDRQEDAVTTLLRMEEMERDPVSLSDEDHEAILEGLAQCERGEFASEEEVQALFDRYRAQ